MNRENSFVRQRLRALGLTVYDGAANYTLFRAPDTLGEKLLKRGILIRSCANYDGLDATYWRVGLKTHTDNICLCNAIEEALKR